MPSMQPSKSAHPSSMPSLKPSESARPSSMPSMQPSKSAHPSSMPSLAPSKSARPSSIPSIQPSKSARPSSMPSLQPSESARPSSMPSMQPSKSAHPSSMLSLQPSESARPSSMPSMQPSISPSLICGSGRELRQLQASPWQLEYEVISSFMCEVAACTSAADIAAVSSIADAISSAIINAMDSGAFLAVLITNIILTSGLEAIAIVFTCLSAWSIIEGPVTDVSASVGTGRFYPDWDYGSGTCLEDGNEPTHMVNDASWVLGSLKECCDRYYWWDTNGCMKVSGSGLWYADVLNEVCVTDCNSGGVCGGLAGGSSKKLYADPRSCCESELAWRFIEFCE
eukprot:scaffold2670_cov79-Cyclotella_meneghiniana.AAC.1